jgi:hypothetical protein
VLLDYLLADGRPDANPRLFVMAGASRSPWSAEKLLILLNPETLDSDREALLEQVQAQFYHAFLQWESGERLKNTRQDP